MSSLRLATIASAAVLMLGACGGSSDGGESAPPTADTTPPTAETTSTTTTTTSTTSTTTSTSTLPPAEAPPADDPDIRNGLVVVVVQETDDTGLDWFAGTRFEPTFTGPEPAAFEQRLAEVSVNEWDFDENIQRAQIGVNIEVTSTEAGLTANLELLGGVAADALVKTVSLNVDVDGGVANEEIFFTDSTSAFVELRWVADDAYDLSGETITLDPTPSDTYMEIGVTSPANLNSLIGNAAIGTGIPATAGMVELRNIDIIEMSGTKRVFALARCRFALPVDSDIFIGQEWDIEMVMTQDKPVTECGAI